MSSRKADASTGTDLDDRSCETDVDRAAPADRCDDSSDAGSVGLVFPKMTYVAPLSDPERTVFTPPVASEQPLGRFDDYDLLEEIARGGMGVVYKARQRKANRLVALKMILSGGHASRQEVERFQAEAEAAARLDHPGIVPIYQVGECDGRHFFSMAFVDGTDLATLSGGKPLRGRDAARLLKPVADAVEYAHLCGVIHRDLKPSNILIDRENRPRVTDFGLAKRLEQDSKLTHSGQVMGTPSYMPPEQARGEAQRVGPESDVYSLGAILYHLLTGGPPFAGTTSWETISLVIDQEPTPPRRRNPEIDSDLETICLRCLQKSPTDRYRSAGELAEELARYLKGEPILARPVGDVERFLRWCRRNPRLAAAVTAAVLAATAAIVTLTIAVVLIDRARDDALTIADTNRKQLDFFQLERDGIEKKWNEAETETEALRKRVKELEMFSEPRPSSEPRP